MEKKNTNCNFFASGGPGVIPTYNFVVEVSTYPRRRVTAGRLDVAGCSRCCSLRAGEAFPIQGRADGPTLVKLVILLCSLTLSWWIKEPGYFKKKCGRTFRCGCTTPLALTVDQMELRC